MQQYWQPGKRDHVISGTGWILPRFFSNCFLVSNDKDVSILTHGIV